jgi:hypothetical protein
MIRGRSDARRDATRRDAPHLAIEMLNTSYKSITNKPP